MPSNQSGSGAFFHSFALCGQTPCVPAKGTVVRLKEEILTLTGVSDEDMHLEQWAFEECAPFFEEVFGIKPQFIMKTLMF